MTTPRHFCLALVLSLPSFACAHQATFPANVQASSETSLESRAHETAASSSPDFNEGLIKLDVVVTDRSGKPAAGLDQSSFDLLDNGHPGKILSFHAYDPASAGAGSPVEVILLIDTISLTFKMATYEREAIESFLRKNGGHLSQPVSIFLLSDRGLWPLAQPSRDGNALAASVARNQELSMARSPLRGQSLAQISFEDHPALAALKTLRNVAVIERAKPGRKLLLWVGASWEIGNATSYGLRSGPERSGSEALDTLSWFSTLVRESRITLDILPLGETDARVLQSGGVKGTSSSSSASPTGAVPASLDINALAIESGGRVMNPTTDMPGETTILPQHWNPDKTTIVLVGTGMTAGLENEIESCVRDTGIFYTVSFDPGAVNHPDEYHTLEIQLAKPGLTAHTSKGYYDQPDYSDQPNPAVRPVTIQQLNQLLAAAHGKRDKDLARELSGLELTDRISSTQLSAWSAEVNGVRSRQALVALADASAFLSPPAADIPADPPPDSATQRRILSLAIDYLGKTMPKLPNLFATRTTLRYEEEPEHYDHTGHKRIGYEPLHLTDNSKATVFYRNGKEVVEAAAKKRSGPRPQDRYLVTYGTFGPILGMVILDAVAAQNHWTWSRWERSSGTTRAVFRYAVPEEKSHYRVEYCCLPEGGGTSTFRKLSGYHGEIAIDPTSGAILRLEIMADLKPTMPIHLSQTLVEYGPVQIGGNTYICPVRSVSISRGRTLRLVTELGQDFTTFGPYATTLNDVTFGDYHVFRSQSRILTGLEAASDKH
jgi:VWFA-related protein